MPPTVGAPALGTLESTAHRGQVLIIPRSWVRAPPAPHENLSSPALGASVTRARPASGAPPQVRLTYPSTSSRRQGSAMGVSPGQDLLARLPHLPSEYIMTWPGPYALLEGLDTGGLQRVADAAFDICTELLSGVRAYPEGETVEYLCASCETVHNTSPELAANRLLMIAGVTWAVAARMLVLDFSNDRLVRFIERLNTVVEVEDSAIGWAHQTLRGYAAVLAAAQGLLAFRTGGHMSPSTDRLEAALVNSALDIYHEFARQVSPEGLCEQGVDAQYLLRRLLGEAFHLEHTVFNFPAKPWSDTHKVGPFSALRLSQLQLLATRSKDAVALYGAKQVERVFEQQLALLMQSLGFYVVPAKPGEASPDLICMSADASERFTILMDAKSSASPYGLPKDDFRALQDYVRDAQSNLATAAPTLAFLLIIGGEASAGLPERLKELEVAAGLPVRFCSAQLLATFREHLLGAMPMAAWKRALLQAERVVADDVLQDVVRVSSEREAAKAQLVRTFMH